MGKVGIILVNPMIKVFGKFKGQIPLIGADKVFLHGAKYTLSIGIPFWIIPSREYLFNAENGTVLHKLGRCRLTAIVSD